MPLVRVTLRRGRSPEFVRGLLDAIHEALVATANVPSDDRFQIVDEVPESHLVANPTYAGVERSEHPIVVEITLNAGRTVETKRALYAGMVARLEPVGVRPDDVLISLIEVSRENWSFGRGLATYALE
jgi:4-oxalocrotonate tautomerase